MEKDLALIVIIKAVFNLMQEEEISNSFLIITNLLMEKVINKRLKSHFIKQNLLE